MDGERAQRIRSRARDQRECGHAAASELPAVLVGREGPYDTPSARPFGARRKLAQSLDLVMHAVTRLRNERLSYDSSTEICSYESGKVQRRSTRGARRRVEEGSERLRRQNAATCARCARESFKACALTGGRPARTRALDGIRASWSDARCSALPVQAGRRGARCAKTRARAHAGDTRGEMRVPPCSRAGTSQRDCARGAARQDIPRRRSRNRGGLRAT